MEKVKQSVKKWFSHICIDGLTGMAWGLFATLIIGTIMGGSVGLLLGPAIIASAILGPVATMVFHMTNNPSGAGMGSAGLVGQIMTWQTMIGTENPVVLIIKIALLHFILPGIIAFIVSYIMRKKGMMQEGDMKLEL